MDKLEQLISSIDFNAPRDAKGHQNIYTHLVALSGSSENESSSVPPPLVFYTARNILYPSFIIGQTPDLLNLLTAAETFRRFAVLKSDAALDWQEYYQNEKEFGGAQDTRLLAANEVRALRVISEKAKGQREEYVLLVQSLIRSYIYYLWTAPEACLLGLRLNDFFPGSIQGIDKPSELLFHTDLSEDEKESFQKLKLECQEWMDRVLDWEDKRDEVGQIEANYEEAAVEDDFHAAFPQPCELSEVVRNVEIYMKKVENVIRKLEKLFPPSKE